MKESISKLEIIQLKKEHMEGAAALLVDRYREGRKINPLWPDKYKTTADVMPLFRHQETDQIGVVAVRDNQLAGFMTSLPYNSFGLPVVWMPDWTHGAVGNDRGNIYRRMYAALAQIWVARGYLKHGVMTFAHERDVLDAWFSIGFGMNGIDAMRDVRSLPGPFAKIVIRQAVPDDLATLVALQKALTFHLRAAPVFAFFPDFPIDAGVDQFRRQLADDNTAIFLAQERDEVIGVMRVQPSGQRDFKMPTYDEKTCGISMAFTLENRRSKGVATALLNHVLAWAREKGYTACAVDFESANIPGSRFWLSHFQPVCYHLARHIEDRVYSQITGGK